MKLKARKLLFIIQVFILNISFFLFYRPLSKRKEDVILGVEEIAGVLHSINKSLSKSKSICFGNNQYYKFDYWLNLENNGFRKYIRFLVAPVLLAYLIRNYKNFIYVGAKGFLLEDIDGRNYEFSKLFKNKCNIICYFTGSDIRSAVLMEKYSAVNEIDVITTYQNIGVTYQALIEKDDLKKKLAESADKYAKAIFNPPTDQMSYIKRKTHPFLYFYDKDEISFNAEKFNQQKKIVLHAPSSPVIKGTPLVRAAVKQLKEEGVDFEYIELTNVSNEVVLENLSRAHIVLNQFYAFVPSVFGIEAMANSTVLLTSADKNIEHSLAEGANSAWIVTPYWKVYFNLKEQLLRPMDELKEQAERGTKWVEKYCTYEYSGTYLKGVIDSLDD